MAKYCQTLTKYCQTRKTTTYLFQRGMSKFAKMFFRRPRWCLGLPTHIIKKRIYHSYWIIWISRSSWNSHIPYWLLAIPDWLLAIPYWLFHIGCRLFPIGSWSILGPLPWGTSLRVEHGAIISLGEMHCFGVPNRPGAKQQVIWNSQ